MFDRPGGHDCLCNAWTVHRAGGEWAAEAPVANNKADDNALLVLQRLEALACWNPCLTQQIPPRPCPEPLRTHDLDLKALLPFLRSFLRSCITASSHFTLLNPAASTTDDAP